MYPLKYICLAAVAVLLLSSCTNQNTVSLVNKNFDKEIELKQNLVFTFDKDLVNDSVLNRWDSTSYISFTPAVRGLFKWNTKRELLFSPETGFAPATDYKADVTSKILQNTPALTLDGLQQFSFHTPYLALTDLLAHWTVNTTDNAVGLLATLNFNYSTNPVQLQSLTKIFLDGKQVPFTLQSNEATSDVVLAVSVTDWQQLKNVNLEVQIEKGLPCVGSSYKTTELLKRSTQIPLPDKLTIFNATGEYDGTQPVIHVYTNQAVDMKDLNSFIQLEPKLNFTTESTPDGFLVKASFDPGQSYRFTLLKNCRGLIGGTLENDFTSVIPFGEMQPSISFLYSNGLYLSSKSNKNIAINITNVPQVKVSIYKLYENNILAFMRQNSYHDYEYDEEGNESSQGALHYNIYGIENLGDLAFQRVYDTKNLPKSKGVNLLNLSLDEINTYKGIYVVNVASSDDYWLRDTKVIALSDIGLIAKQGEDEITVFANFIKTAEPASGVKVKFISTNNQVMYSAITDGDGKATFSHIISKSQNFRTGMITSHYGKDYNMLILNDTRVSTSRFETGGRTNIPGGYMAYLYGDRDIYRPGETIYQNTIVRNASWQPVADMQVKIKMLLPNGHEFKSLRKTLNKQGAATAEFQLPAASVTGNYVIDVYTANDVLLGSRTINVEEFMPDRIDVKLTSNKEEFSVSDTIITHIKATSLFGPPATGRNYEFEFNLVRKNFYSKQFPDYNFSVTTANNLQFEKKVEQGKTDDKGEASAKFSVPAQYAQSGLLQAKIYATVFDETGRPVNRLITGNVNTQDVYYGIRINDYYATRGSNMTVDLAACNKNGNGINAEAFVEVVNNDWYNVVEKTDNGNYRYVSQKREVVVLSKKMSISAQGSKLNFIPSNSGEYEVRVSRNKGENYSASSFWAYGYGYTSNSSFNINTEGQVTIQADKDTFLPGEKANILFKTPFQGKLLVTVESDKLLHYYYLNTDKRSAMLSLPIEESYLPNVYVTATLFRPLDDGSMPLTVAHGFMPLMVSKPDLKIPVTIECADKSRSKTKQSIKIKTPVRGDVEVTIAIVDEGILALKNQKTPDPYGYFYQKQALQVNSYDMYAKLLPDLQMKSSLTGGDGYDLSRRINPLTNKRVQLVALWSGILKTNAAGEAYYNIDIPQFSGDLRVMACVWSNNRFGSADKHIKVADPVVISPSIPRFLSPGDTLQMPVTFTNSTNAPLKCNTACSVTGNLKLLNAANLQTTIAAGTEFVANWTLVAGSTIGNADIIISAKSGSDNFTDKTNITIRPPSSLVKETSSGELSGTKSLTIASDFIPSSAAMKLVVSNSPLVQFSDELSYLLDYPHGCLEQTVSIAFPQIYYGDLAKTITTKTNFTYDAHSNVQEAIRKIESMQIYNGSLTYWPGSVIENWWSTAYALHFLTEADKAGYDVNNNTVNKIFEYLKQKVKLREVETVYELNKDNVIIKNTRAKREIIYSLYLLALNGKQDLSSMNYYKSNHTLLTADSRYMLACAYQAIGDTKSSIALMPEKFGDEKSIRSTNGNFHSYIRDYALSLNCLLETDAGNPQIPQMARTLSQIIQKEKWMSTQERAFSFLALGKFVSKNVSKNVKGTLFSGGKQIAEFSGKDLILKDKNLIGKTLEIKTQGEGKLYWFLEVSGIKENTPVKEEDSKIMVRKSFFNRFGQPLLNTFKQGELIVVQIALTSQGGMEADNIVVTDMIPSGFEIENPRITDEREMTWIKNQQTPDYFDIRDDRINLYTSSGKTTRYYYYTVRAVSTGSFIMGPVSADAMYNGEIHSYSGAGRVHIIK